MNASAELMKYVRMSNYDNYMYWKLRITVEKVTPVVGRVIF